MHTLETDHYFNQLPLWPTSGKVIMAQHDAESVIVYQAYKPSIGHYAAKHSKFGGDFSLSRMTWIKPNFLWMMYRSGWGTKENQEVTLAVKIHRTAFEQILALAVPSAYDKSLFSSSEQWQMAVKESDVRLQWDPDHDPYGDKQQRRAIQLGLRGETVQRYVDEWIVDIQDISEFVAEQRQAILDKDLNALRVPKESAFWPQELAVAKKLGLDI